MVVLCEGRWWVGINFSHALCMVVSKVDGPFGSFLCSVVQGRSRVALRVSVDVLREIFLPGLYPLGSRASITLVGWMCNVAPSFV